MTGASVMLSTGVAGIGVAVGTSVGEAVSCASTTGMNVLVASGVVVGDGVALATGNAAVALPSTAGEGSS